MFKMDLNYGLTEIYLRGWSRWAANPDKQPWTYGEPYTSINRMYLTLKCVRNGYLMSRRGCSSPANASGLDPHRASMNPHRASITSCSVWQVRAHAVPVLVLETGRGDGVAAGAGHGAAVSGRPERVPPPPPPRHDAHDRNNSGLAEICLRFAMPMLCVMPTLTLMTPGRYRSQWPVIEPPWSRLTSDCRRCWHPPRPNH
jgi:hypothetical protein